MQRVSIQVLSSRDTRGWHSPFSRTLRDLRQGRILNRCARVARRQGFAEFALYDAFETLIATGTADA